MPTLTPKAEVTPSRPTDPPFLIAILIGGMKTGDKMLVGLAREWLAEQGIRIVIAKDSPALSARGGGR